LSRRKSFKPLKLRRNKRFPTTIIFSLNQTMYKQSLRMIMIIKMRCEVIELNYF
jgi:hypothetical protein